MPTPNYKVALLAESYVPDDAHDEFSDVQADEISGDGYSAGGKLLAGVTVEVESETDIVLLACDDAIWEDAEFAARYGFVYRQDTGAAVKLIDFGFEVPVVDGGTFTLKNPLDLILAFGLQSPEVQIDSVMGPDALTLAASLHQPMVITSEAPGVLAATMALLEPMAYSDAVLAPASFAVEVESVDPSLAIESGNAGNATSGGIGIAIQTPTIDIQDGLIPTPGRLQAGATQRTPAIQTFDARETLSARATLREPEIWLGVLYPGVQAVRATLHAPSAVVDYAVAKSPGQMSQFGSGFPWNDLNNGKVADGNVATSSPTSSGNSKTMRASNFGFAVPSGATILGAKISIKRKSASPSSVLDDVVWLTQGGNSGNNLADLITHWPTTLTVKDYGGPTDLCGLALTPAIVNAVDFAVDLSVNEVDVASVDHIELTIYYRA